MRSAWLLPLLCALPAQEPPPPERVIATHYYYWYHWPDEHLPQGPHDDRHRYHFRDVQQVSYRDPAWHERELRAMAAHGIDVAWAVYFSAPGLHHRWPYANAGIAPMVAALDRIEQSGGKGAKVGLFYDTTTLANEARGLEPRTGGVDLRRPEGKASFIGTVLEFYEQIPARHWARLRGGALIGLYSSNTTGGWDRSLVPALRAEFARRFPGERITLVADRSWGSIGQDLTTEWGAALLGPKLFHGVAQIGPGYDDTRVPGRTAPVREREDGNWYRWSWLAAIRSRPELIVIETWNEMYEGTNVCDSVELGPAYLELTRTMAALWRRGLEPPEVTLRHARARGRADLAWGEEAKGETEIAADYGVAPPLRRGLRELAPAGAPPPVRPDGLAGQGRIPFQVSDHWRFDVDEGLELECVVGGPGPVGIEYDSESVLDPRGDRYARARLKLRDRERWVFTLPHARFANRQDDGADFRVISLHPIVLRSIRLRVAD